MPDGKIISLISGAEGMYKNGEFHRRLIPKGGWDTASHSREQSLALRGLSCSSLRRGECEWGVCSCRPPPSGRGRGSPRAPDSPGKDRPPRQEGAGSHRPSFPKEIYSQRTLQRGRAVPSQLVSTGYSDGCGSRCGVGARSWWIMVGLFWLVGWVFFCLLISFGPK